jgi:hypothetical protein
MGGYVWYSGGSDVSGQKLAEAISFGHGKKTPKMEGLGVLVGWGCKAETRERYDPEKIAAAVAAGDLRILNYPQAISEARNKLELLIRLKEAGGTVPGFVDLRSTQPAAIPGVLGEAIDQGELTLPCVGFSATHRGRPVFCWTREDLQKATEVNRSRKKDAIKIEYFRSLLQGPEYRIHVFRDEALGAEIKELAKDPVKATADSLYSRLKRRAGSGEKAGELSATSEELQWVVAELSQDLLQGPSHLQKSTLHGWTMKETDMESVPVDVLGAAIFAVEAAGLDMGAVSVIFEEGSAVITNVISAPGLSETQLPLYVEAIQDFAGAEAVPEKAKKAESPATASEGTDASNEIRARLTRKIRMGKITEKQAKAALAALE